MSKSKQILKLNERNNSDIIIGLKYFCFQIKKAPKLS